MPWPIQWSARPSFLPWRPFWLSCFLLYPLASCSSPMLVGVGVSIETHRNDGRHCCVLTQSLRMHVHGAYTPYTPCLWTGLLCISYNECLPVTDLSHATVSHTHTQTLTILLTFLVSLQSGHSTAIKCIVSSRDTIMAILNVGLYQFPPLLSATCRQIGLGNNGRGKNHPLRLQIM